MRRPDYREDVFQMFAALEHGAHCVGRCRLSVHVAGSRVPFGDLVNSACFVFIESDMDGLGLGRVRVEVMRVSVHDFSPNMIKPLRGRFERG